MKSLTRFDKAVARSGLLIWGPHAAAGVFFITLLALR